MTEFWNTGADSVGPNTTWTVHGELADVPRTPAKIIISLGARNDRSMAR